MRYFLEVALLSELFNLPYRPKLMSLDPCSRNLGSHPEGTISYRPPKDNHLVIHVADW